MESDLEHDDYPPACLVARILATNKEVSQVRTSAQVLGVRRLSDSLLNRGIGLIRSCFKRITVASLWFNALLVYCLTFY